MIKIAFLMPYLNCGGVESTLISLLNVLDQRKYDVTLLLLQRNGVFADRIPKGVTIRDIPIPEREQGVFFGKKNHVAGYLKKGRLWKALQAFSYNAVYSISEDRTENVRYFDHITDTLPLYEDEFDIAVDYFGYATFTTFYLAEKMRAKKKISWLHSVMFRFQPQEFAKYYEKIDRCIAVSGMVKNDFQSIFGTICPVTVFYNIIDAESIRRKAEEPGGFSDDFSGVRILTVARVTHEKGVDLAVEVLRRLVDRGYDVRWYVIGAGEDIEPLEKTLKGTKYESRFLFLGRKDNPCPYMKQCDLYVQPSRFEGYCTTTNEARIIGCPVVTTDVSGARDQFVDGVTGVIVPVDAAALYGAVENLITHQNERMRYRDALMGMDFVSDRKEELLQLLGG